MNNLKQFMLTVLVVLVSNLTANAHDFLSNGIYYNITSSEALTCEVTYKGTSYSSANSYSGAVVIPSSITYGGKTYKVTGIGEYAFYECTSLTSLTIPRNISYIKSNAFYGIQNYNASFTEVHIEDLAAWCSVDFNGTGASPMCGNNYSNRRKLYLNNVEVTNLNALSGATEIKNLAFYFNYGLTSIDIPESVTTIGSGAFIICPSVIEVNIPNSLTNVVWGDNFGPGFPLLTSINVSESHPTLKTVDGALYSKDGETLVKWPSGKHNNGSVVLPNGIKTIGESAFAGADVITSIEVPEGVTSIGKYAFHDCNQLTTLTLPQSLSKIGFNAFYFSSYISSVYVKDLESWCNVDYENKESYVSSLDGQTKFNYSESIFSPGFGNYDFYVNDVKVTNLVIPQNVINIAPCLFSNANIESVKFHSNIQSIGYNAFSYCNSLKSANIEDLQSWCNIDFESRYSNPLYYAKNLYLDGELVTDLVIPSNITEVKNNTFCNATCLKTVTLHENLTSIGDYAFYGINKPQTIDLPKTLTKIGSYAFNNCSSITSIKLPYRLKEIGSSAFYGCTNLTTIYNASKLQLEKGSWENGCVAYYATDIINIVPEIKVYNGNSDVVFVEGLEEAEAEATADNALVFAEIDEDNLPANYVVENEAKSIVITDAQPFYCPIDVEAETINYVRNFTSTNLQALYLPYAMSYNDWKDKAKVSYINDVHQFDDDDDGEIDRTVLEFISVKSGDLAPNIPYLIKPLEKGETTFTSCNKTLKATLSDGYIDCSSTRMLYTLKGTYQTRDDIYANGYYAMSGGTFKVADNAGVKLSPFRIFLSITNRYGNGAVPRAKKITIMVDGVEEETTDIDEIMMSDAQPTEIYNLQGVRVDEGYKGIVIKNGRKVLVK